MAPKEEEVVEEEEEERLDHTNYKILCEIGSNVSAVVYKAIFLPNNSVVAIKAIDLDQSINSFENIVRDSISLNLSHPNLLSPHCFFKVDRRLWIVMPFFSTGSLQSIVSSSFPDGLPELCISLILKQVLNALSYLYNEGNIKIHGDIKSGNIFIDSKGFVKLSDFGYSTSFYNSNCTYSSPYWMAPEVIIQNLQMKRLDSHDIWDVGVSALELAYGGPPLSYNCFPISKSLLLKIKDRFQFLNCSEIQNQIKENKNKDNKKKNFSNAFKEMVASCLNRNPSKRPNVEQLLNFPFFKNNDLGVEFLEKNVFLETPNIEEWFKESNKGLKKIGDCDFIEDESDIQKGKSGRNIVGWELNEDGFELEPISARSAGKRVVESDESILNPSSLSQHAMYESNTRSIDTIISCSDSMEEAVLDDTYYEQTKNYDDELIIDIARKHSEDINKSVRDLLRDIKVDLDEGGSFEKDAVIGILIGLKENLEDERKQMLEHIKNLGGEMGWDVYKELEIMSMRSKRLKMEYELAMGNFENEKMKINDLELQNVKMKRIIDELELRNEKLNKSHKLELENKKVKIIELELELNFLKLQIDNINSAGGCEESK